MSNLHRDNAAELLLRWTLTPAWWIARIWIRCRTHALYAGSCGAESGSAGTGVGGATLLMLFVIASHTFAAPLLPDRAMEKLKRAIAERPDAAARFEELREVADELLTRVPNPARHIRSEGLLAADPLRVATYESLKDINRLDALAYAHLVTGDAKYRDKAVEILGAWASTNEPRGNPIDDTKLDRAILAYGLLRESMSDGERAPIDAWLRAVAVAERDNVGKWPGGTKVNNWHSHRLMIVGLIGFLTDDRPSIDYVTAEFPKHLANNLRPDGSSLDFHERDALHYHCYDLQPMLRLAWVGRQFGHDFYGLATPSGASLKTSVAFLVPYADGTKTHEEFVRSKVAFDAKRAASGDKHYEKGKLFQPQQALGVLELAAAFDETLVPLAASLAGRPTSWQLVLNAAVAP